LRFAFPIRAILYGRSIALTTSCSFATVCGCKDADDVDALREDPGFRLALDQLPGSGAGLVSQPKISRGENAPTPRALARTMAARMMAERIDISCASYPAAPAIGASPQKC